MTGTKVKLAAIQAEPVWSDLQGSVEKTCQLIQDAAAAGANVIAFPETWIPGYPRYIWRESVRESASKLEEVLANSMRRHSPEMRRIREATKAAGACVVLGYSERDGGSIYMANVFIGPDGTQLHHRRKIKPTSIERSVWGEGQADSLQVVTSTPYGNIGALNCWENYQPLLRYAEYSQGVDIHVACWPTLSDGDAGSNKGYHVKGSANLKLCQVIAMEGATFVMVASSIYRGPGGELEGPGFSTIFGPDGSELTERLLINQEGFVMAEIDLRDRDAAHRIIDVVGHYSRPDLLSLNIKKEPAKHVHYV
ncbi:CN hydrolase domain-containing protein [Fusarium sp. LHS14.1]|nr:CN hydrolase domain-containing protein [Fusarium sp. LHS14.1]